MSNITIIKKVNSVWDFFQSEQTQKHLLNKVYTNPNLKTDKQNVIIFH